jgi:predicted dehydrogenase
VVAIGAGGIVRSAHGPAYRKVGIPYAGVFDVDRAAARRAARELAIPRVFATLAEAAAAPGAVFDVAVPAGEILGVLAALPARAAVLIQKPMGRDLAEARKIVGVCRAKRLAAAVNFQLRFAPNMLALRDAIARGRLGRIADAEFRVCTHTPWPRWKFLARAPRLEIVYHSIHYLDLARSLFGDPNKVWAAAARDPRFPGYADARSTIALEFGALRCVVTTDHGHAHGARHAASSLKVEGSRGAAVATMGVNLNYPKGRPDTLEIASGDRWHSARLAGSWFPDAFAGTMSNLQRFVAGEDRALVSPAADALRTMALVEACYRSSRTGFTNFP